MPYAQSNDRNPLRCSSSGECIRSKKHASDYVGLVGGRFAASLLSALGFGLVTRFLGASAYGQYALVVMIGTVVSTVVIIWPNPGVIRYGREELRRSGGIATAESSWVPVPALVAVSLVVRKVRHLRKQKSKHLDALAAIL